MLSEERAAHGASSRLLPAGPHEHRADVIEHDDRVEKLLTRDREKMHGLLADGLDFAADPFAGFQSQFDALARLAFQDCGRVVAGLKTDWTLGKGEGRGERQKAGRMCFMDLGLLD